MISTITWVALYAALTNQVGGASFFLMHEWNITRKSEHCFRPHTTSLIDIHHWSTLKMNYLTFADKSNLEPTHESSMWCTHAISTHRVIIKCQLRNLAIWYGFFKLYKLTTAYHNIRISTFLVWKSIPHLFKKLQV